MGTLIQPGERTLRCYVDIPDINEHITAGNTEAVMRAAILANFNDTRAGGIGGSQANIVLQGDGAWLVTRNTLASDVLNFNLQCNFTRAITDDQCGAQILGSINYAVRGNPNVRPAIGHSSAWAYMGGFLYDYFVEGRLPGQHVVYDVENGRVETQTNSSDSVVGRVSNYVFNGNRQASTEGSRDGNTPGGNLAGDTINWGAVRIFAYCVIGASALIAGAAILTTVKKAVS